MTKYKCLYDITGRIEDVATFLVPLQDLPKHDEPVIDKSAAIRIATALGWTPPRQEHDEPVVLLSNLVNALDNAFISSWQSTHHWSKQLDEARDYLATHGIGENA